MKNIKDSDFISIGRYSGDNESIDILPEAHLKLTTDNTDFPKYIEGIVESVDEDGTIIFSEFVGKSADADISSNLIPQEYIIEIKIVEED